jgi:hypothetical protein
MTSDSVSSRQPIPPIASPSFARSSAARRVGRCLALPESAIHRHLPICCFLTETSASGFCAQDIFQNKVLENRLQSALGPCLLNRHRKG